MAKLHFYYAAMNAGKSTVLIQSSYNYHERGMATVIYTPEIDTRNGENLVASRIGISAKAIGFSKNFDLYQSVQQQISHQPKLRCVLVDEAQFLTKTQIQQLCRITDELSLPVLAYGLRSDFQGEVFEGSKYLLAWADVLTEIKTICFCGSKATMNLRVDDTGVIVRDGQQVEIGGNNRYISVCRAHFYSLTHLPNMHLV